MTLPILDGRKAERAFRVVGGGFLDLRFVRLYRGHGIKVNDNTNIWFGE